MLFSKYKFAFFIYKYFRKINYNYVCIEKDQFTINLKVKSFGKINNIMVKF